jgi:hypothetical protein
MRSLLQQDALELAGMSTRDTRMQEAFVCVGQRRLLVEAVGS